MGRYKKRVQNLRSFTYKNCTNNFGFFDRSACDQPKQHVRRLSYHSSQSQVGAIYESPGVQARNLFFVSHRALQRVQLMR